MKKTHIRVTVSVATSLDGYMDDLSPRRLRLSSDEDWAEVLALRAQFDAILVGEGTVRADNPSLVIRDPQARAARIAAGMPADIMKVTLSHDLDLDPAARFFTEGAGRKVVFIPAGAVSGKPDPPPEVDLRSSSFAPRPFVSKPTWPSAWRRFAAKAVSGGMKSAPSQSLACRGRQERSRPKQILQGVAGGLPDTTNAAARLAALKAVAEVVELPVALAASTECGERTGEVRTDAKPSAIELARMAEARRRKASGAKPTCVASRRTFSATLSPLVAPAAPEAQFSPRAVVEALAAMGCRSVMVEGGSRVLHDFFAAGVVDELRLAVAPVTVGQQGAPRFDPPGNLLLRSEHMAGETAVGWYDVARTDGQLLLVAVRESEKCTPSQSAYSVGAMIVTRTGQIFKGYSRETAPHNHAEEEALNKALAAGAKLEGATIYSSVEPCSERASKQVSCSQLIIRHRLARVVYALGEPERFVRGHGRDVLRRAGVSVTVIGDYAQMVKDINRHLL